MPRAKPYHAAYMRTRRVAAFAAGLCFECAIRPHVEGRRRCEKCLRNNVERQTAIVAAGGCRGICGRPRPEGRSRCDVCREKHREYMKKRREARGAVPRPTRPQQVPSISVVPSAGSHHPPPTDGPRKEDPAPPAEVDLSKRRLVIAALAARRAA